MSIGPVAAWVALGAVLLIAELVLPVDFYFFCLGTAALVVGGLVALGLVESATAQWATFGVAGIVLVFGVRRWFRARFGGQPDTPQTEELVGEAGTATAPIAPGGLGKVELRGSLWNARNTSDRSLVKDQRVRVRAVRGLTLEVLAEETTEQKG